MARNTLLQAPPLTVPIPAQSWLDWFRDLHFRISNKNHQTITGARAINLDSNHVSLDSTDGGFAATLEPPTVPGIFKSIEMTVDGGDVTLALTNIVVAGSAPTGATFDAVGQALLLYSLTTKWLIVNNYGVTLA